eukprot:INCI9402.1.p1 GENE.INCI9402.1~~INCI9402.1.p1  ORF type:complete len:580 (+),score=90.89 INCI9402.1:166-1905(+)
MAWQRMHHRAASCLLVATIAAASVFAQQGAEIVCNASSSSALTSRGSGEAASHQCSGHGECEPPGTCVCEEGYNGTECAVCAHEFVAVCYSEDDVPGESLCGSALAHEIEEKPFATLFFCFGMVLLLGILIEFFIHFLKHLVHHEKWAKKILDSLIAELVTLGLISFVLFLVSNACGSETLHTDFFDLEVFEYLHMLLFITVAIFLCTVMFLILSGLALLQCIKSYLSEAAVIVKERSRSKATDFASSPAATDDCEAAPPAPPRRQRKKGNNAKSVTTGSYLDQPAPATARSSLLGSAPHVDGVGSAHSGDSEKPLERKLRQTEAGELDAVDAVDPGDSAPRLTMVDLLPALGCVCRRGAAHDFHVERLATFHQHLVDELRQGDDSDEFVELDMGQYLKNCFLQDCERVVTLGWQLYLLTIVLVPIISAGPIFETITRVVIVACHITLFWKGCDMQRRLQFILQKLRHSTLEKTRNTATAGRGRHQADSSWIKVANRGGSRMSLRHRIDAHMLKKLTTKPARATTCNSCRKRMLGAWCGDKVPDDLPFVKVCMARLLEESYCLHCNGFLLGIRETLPVV